MKSLLITLSTVTMFFSGCNHEARKNEKAAQVQPKIEALSELEALDDQLPEAAVMRVELDAEGNVIPGTEDLRTVSKLSAASIAESFDASEAPKAGSAELDQDSSTQSWFMTQVEDAKQTNPNQTSQQYPNQGQANQYPSQGQPNQYPNNQTNQSGYPSTGYPNQGQANQYPTNQTNQSGYPSSSYPSQGPSSAAYPVSTKTIYEHRTKDVYPQQQVDIYPIEKVRIHPTQVTTRVHPVQRQVEYVGNHCQQNYSACNYGSQYYPTVSYGSYNQYYHYQSYQNFGNYRYYRYCRPRIFARLFGW